MSTASLAEYVDGLPSLCGSEHVVAQAMDRSGPVYLPECGIDFGGVRSAFSIALHMHQPLIPVENREPNVKPARRLVFFVTRDWGALAPEAPIQIPLDRISRLSRRSGQRVLVSLGGMRTNRFCRAADIPVTLHREGVVITRGFHKEQRVLTHRTFRCAAHRIG